MITFNIYPENKSLYCRVYVFDTKEEMYNFDVSEQKDYEAKFTEVEQTSYRTNPKGRKTPLMGLIYFYKDKCGAGVVSHEMTHAAVAWCRRKKVDFTALERAEEFKEYGNKEKIESDSETEEDLAWVLGNLVSQFYKHYYDTQEDY